MIWSALVDISLKGALLLAAAWALTFALRRASAATRHLLWTTAMAGLLVLSGLSVVLPLIDAPRLVAPVTLPAIVADITLDVTAQGPPAQSGGVEWRRWVWLVWLGGAALLALRLGVAIAVLGRLIARGSRLDVARQEAGEVATRLGLRRPVRILCSEDVTMPISCGLWSHVVLLPQEAARWPEARLRVVLLHEMAHAARFDPMTQLLAQAVCCLYWFNPLVWVAARSMAIEREKACDDRVLACGAAASEYAGHLVEIARTLRGRKPWLAAAIAMASRSQLEPRLLSILDRQVRRRALTRKRVAIAATAALLLVVPLAATRTRSGNNAAASGVHNSGVTEPPPRNASKVSGEGRRDTKSTYSSVTQSVTKKEKSAMSSKLAVGLLAGAMAFGASISGNVYDPSAAVVPDAAVILSNTAMGAEVRSKTNAGGQYEFPSLVPGVYEVRVEVPGFKLQRRRLKLDTDTARKETFWLEVGQVTESLTVMAAGTPRPQAVTPQRIRVGGNLQATRLLRMPRPVYPETARAEGREGTVEMMAVIGKDGTIGSLTVMPNADPDLAAAAMEAVGRWQYAPTLLNGEPVEVVTKIDVNFKLSQ